MDTNNFIERTAKQYAHNYRHADKWMAERYAHIPNRRKEKIATQLWMVKDYNWYIRQAMNSDDRYWFNQQKSSYKSTIVWKIFIRFVDLISGGK